MIKVYLDWNVIAQMKGGYLNELLEILSNKDKFLIPYSTSHIGDIFSSYSEDDKQKKRIDEDLEFITSLTNNLCLSNTGSEVTLDTTNPKKLMQDKINDKDIMNDFSLDSLEELMSDNSETKEIGKMLIALYKSIPLGTTYTEALENPESGEYLNQIFPDLKENPTMGGLLNSFSKMYTNLNEKEDYKILREVTQKGLGINRDKIYNNTNPYQLIDKVHSKLGVSLDKYIDNTKNAPEWFNKITNEYIMLDMHGYQEDKVRVKQNRRKETFTNTTEDAFHSSFASTCNFYIINDKKSYNKTKQTYDRLKINTIVFKPNEYIEYYKKFLNINKFVEHFKMVIELITTNNYFENTIENGIMKTYLFPYFIFDFFNKIVVIKMNDNEQPIMLLSKIPPTNKSNTYYLEIIKLINKFNDFLGKDLDNLGGLKINELESENWVGRTWDLNGIEFNLICPNGYFQLYFSIKQ